MLRTLCDPVTDISEARRVIENLWSEFESAPLPAAGLAAPQIGVGKRVIVVQLGDDRLSLVNPSIMKRSGRQEVGPERCLSIEEGQKEVQVARSDGVIVWGTGKDGRRVTLRLTGGNARVVQHEIDHLNGVLIIDKEVVL